jgi:translation initiation factor IF-1
MVKNDGGNKGKGLARKHVNAAKCGGSKQLRMAAEDAEQYAVVSKMLGNGMCYVRLLSGGGDRLCIIRNKFKGRGKRDNILDSGSWVLVGMREWSSKQDTCDLLEVYNHGERDRLMKNEPCFKSIATESDADVGNASVQFADSTTLKYGKLVKGQTADGGSDGGSDGGDLVQQRVYDLPSSSDDDDSDDDDSAECESNEAVALKPGAVAALTGAALTGAALTGAALKPGAVAALKPDAIKPKLKVDHINVDDI